MPNYLLVRNCADIDVMGCHEGLMMRHSGAVLFAGEELLLVQISTFLTFSIFYMYQNFYKRGKERKVNKKA